MIIFLVVSTGIMAGVYFTFSVFVMKSLAELPILHAAKTMNKINDVILKTIFLPIFFGSTLLYGVLMVRELISWQGGRSLLLFSAGLVYIIGMFLVTAFGNVPLNKKLKKAEITTSELSSEWQRYLKLWTGLNHLRTISCLVSLTLLSMSL